MNKTYLTLLFAFTCSLALAQPWMRYVDPQEPQNFFTIQNAFRQYETEYLKEQQEEMREGRRNGNISETSESEEHELPGFEVYKRWEWFWEARVDSAGNFPDP